MKKVTIITILVTILILPVKLFASENYYLLIYTDIAPIRNSQGVIISLPSNYAKEISFLSKKNCEKAKNDFLNKRPKIWKAICLGNPAFNF